MFQGKRVTLRSLELDDIPEIMQHFNDLEIRQFLNRIIPVSAEEEKEWIRNTWKHRREGIEYVFAIELRKPKKIIGACALNRVNSIHQNAELGIAIYNKQYWGKGLGTEAIHLLLDFGFNKLNLHRIYLMVSENNHRAKRVYEKVGFQITGRRRHAFQRFNKYYDWYFMDLLAREYRKHQQ